MQRIFERKFFPGRPKDAGQLRGDTGGGVLTLGGYPPPWPFVFFFVQGKRWVQEDEGSTRKRCSREVLILEGDQRALRFTIAIAKAGMSLDLS